MKFYDTTIGNIFLSDAMALVCPTNLKAISDKGLFLEFKNKFPESYQKYKNICDNKKLDIGNLFVDLIQFKLSHKYIIYFPIKMDNRCKSKLEYIEKSLKTLNTCVQLYDIKSIAIPVFECENINWNKIKEVIIKNLENIEIKVKFYE